MTQIMILIDLNQVLLSGLMAQISGQKNIKLEEDLIRHMILNILRNHIKNFKSEYGEVVLCCDNRKYWRKDFFPFYKASRKKNREKSNLDWNLIFNMLAKFKDELKENFPYKVIDVEGAEADDVIAVLCERSQTADLQAPEGLFGEPQPEPILILSGDHDFIQLQKYKNVHQYSPIHKKWIKPESSIKHYLMEHIIKGDKGDGIPNILSADNSLVEGIRQKPIRQTKMDEWYNDPSTMPQTDDFKANFQRNKVLVDFREIPKDVEESIINNFVNQPKKDKSQLLNYFIKHKMKLLMDDLDQF